MYFIETRGKERISGKWFLSKTLKDPMEFFDINKKHKINFFGNFKIDFLITMKFSKYCNLYANKRLT